MTPAEAKNLLAWTPIMQAIADGRTVQHRTGVDYPWIDADGLNASDMKEAPVSERWRIKPEAREWWPDPIQGYLYESNDFEGLVHVLPE